MTGVVRKVEDDQVLIGTNEDLLAEQQRLKAEVT